jgi:hypothetical protein
MERERHDIRIYADVYNHVRSWDDYSHFRAIRTLFARQFGCKLLNNRSLGGMGEGRLRAIFKE